MKCLIIAAGQGTRLAHKGDSKPLVPLLGVPLIERVILSACEAGVNDFLVVTGFNGDKVRDRLRVFRSKHPLTIDFIHNAEWEKPNGISVLCAREKLAEPFFLLMCDHLFDAAILTELAGAGVRPGEVKLAVDRRIQANPLVDMDDVTRVLAKNGQIVDIGKNIPQYNAFDTGIFLCTPALFPALAESVSRGDASLSGGIRRLAGRQDATTFDIGSRSWIDVDDDLAFEKAQQIIGRQSNKHAS